MLGCGAHAVTFDAYRSRYQVVIFSYISAWGLRF